MDLTKEKILNGVVLGLELEFYSTKPRSEIAKELTTLIKKKVVVGQIYHAERNKTDVVVEPDFSGGIRMHEIITPPLPYHESMAIMFKLFTWIRLNGYTDEKCAFQANISFDKFKCDLKTEITAINRMKYVLGFDEEYIYDRFPKRKNSIYARSINSIFPINRFMFNADVEHVYKENYELPNEKYYGINFSKLAKGYLEIRYMGGRGYEKMVAAAKEVIDYTSIFTYNTLSQNQTYTEAEVARLKNAMKDFKKMVSSFNDYDSFCLNYPNMRILVDLKGEREIMKTYYPMIRDKVFDLIVRCGMRRGIINYDADAGKYQVKGAVLTKAFPLRNVEVFESKIMSGNILECDLYRCEISNSHILDCNVYQGNNIKKSKLINTPIHAYNELIDCFIDSKEHIINGKIEGGIIRSGDIGPLAKVSKATEIISAAMDAKDGKDGMGKDGYRNFDSKDKDMPKTADAFRFDINKKDAKIR